MSLRLVLCLLAVALFSAIAVKGLSVPETWNNLSSETLLSRMKRNKFVKKFLEKSKATQEKVKEMDNKADNQEWPIIAWKIDADIFEIGDNGEMESSVFVAIVEEEIPSVVDKVDDFSLKPALSYKGELKNVQNIVSFYSTLFIAMCAVLGTLNFAIIFIRYWLVRLVHLVLRTGLSIEFPGKEGPMRQEFIYAMAFAIENDLLDDPGTRMEQGFAACLNDIVVSVESYTKSR